MSYTKTEWKARKGSNLKRFEKARESSISVELHNAPNAITQEGTPFSEANMNHIEEGIFDAHELIAAEEQARIGADALKQDKLNRTVGGNDNATGTVNDTGGNLSVPIPVTVAAPAASNTQTTAGTRSLRAQLKILIDNIASLFSKTGTIEGKIPNQASNSNQLADKDFVNSSIQNMAARYVTPTAAMNTQWASFAALQAGPYFINGVSGTPSNNDYAIFTETDNSVWRAKYITNAWSKQYKINDTPFTAAQLAAINSNITAAITALAQSAYQKPSAGIPKTDLVSAVQTSLNKADTALQSVPDKHITNARLADMAANTIKGRKTNSTGVPEDIPVTDVRAMLQDANNRFITDTEKSNWNKVSQGIDVTSQTLDLNTYFKWNGLSLEMIYSLSDAGTGNIENKPAAYAFLCECRRHRQISSTDYRMSLTFYTLNRIYRRWNNSGTWSAWKLLSEDNVAPINAGGTGASTAAGARTNLGIDTLLGNKADLDPATGKILTSQLPPNNGLLEVNTDNTLTGDGNYNNPLKVVSAPNVGKPNDGVTIANIFANPPLNNMAPFSYHFFHANPFPTAYKSPLLSGGPEAWNVLTFNINYTRALQIAIQTFDSDPYNTANVAAMFIRTRHVDNTDFTTWQSWRRIGEASPKRIFGGSNLLANADLPIGTIVVVRCQTILPYQNTYLIYHIACQNNFAFSIDNNYGNSTLMAGSWEVIGFIGTTLTGRIYPYLFRRIS